MLQHFLGMSTKEIILTLNRTSKNPPFAYQIKLSDGIQHQMNFTVGRVFLRRLNVVAVTFGKFQQKFIHQLIHETQSNCGGPFASARCSCNEPLQMNVICDYLH